MFDFLDEDWFIITLEIIFIILIIYDIRQYLRTKKKEYITNIVLTAGFAVWTLMPMYTKYIGWEEFQRDEYSSLCTNKDANATQLCECINDSAFKEYTHKAYSSLDKTSKEYTEFMKDTKEDCLDDSWF